MSTCLTCMGSQVRVLYCPPSSRTKKDIYAKNPEVSTTSGLFCARFLKSEKKISKRVLAKSVDLNLYPRDFGPLFREFFGKAARFCSRQSVEFRLAFLLVLPNAHSKHRCWCVSPLCDVSDVKTAGKPHPTPGRKHGVLAMLGREKAKHPLQRSGWPFICWISAEHRFLMSRPSCLCGLRGYRGRAARETSARSECGSNQTQRVYSRADGAAPGDSAHV